MKKIIIFGDLPIATKVTKDLLSRKSVRIVGIVIGNKTVNNCDPWSDSLLEDYSIKKNIKKYKLDELSEIFSTNELHLGFACRFSKIIKQDVIDLFKFGIINFHGGLLPERAGLYTVCHSILLDDKFAGGTLHFIDSNLDTGDIIAKKKFSIEKNDTSYDLFKKTQILLWNLYLENIDNILNGKSKRFDQNNLHAKSIERRYFDKDSIKWKKKIEINNKDYKKIKRTTLAFDFPNHLSAYIQNEEDFRIFLTTNEKHSRSKKNEKIIRSIIELDNKYCDDKEFGLELRKYIRKHVKK